MGFKVQIAIIGSHKGVVEDHSVCNCAETAKFVSRADHVQKSGGPGISTAACVAGFGDPHLGAGTILIPQLFVIAGSFPGNPQIFFRKGLVPRPVYAQESSSFRKTVVHMIAVYICLLFAAFQEIFRGNHG